jgi:hypothetical protein
LRFYDETDFTFLGQLTSPRLGRNRLTVAAILVALVLWQCAVPVLAKALYFFSRRTDQPSVVDIVERSSREAWDRRNRETDRLAEEKQRRRENRTRAENERAEAKEQAARRARIS